MSGRLWPRSLVGRSALVLLLGVVVSNLIGLLVYSGDRFDVLTSARGQDLAERMAEVVRAFEAAEPADRAGLARSMRRPGLYISWSSAPLAQGDLTGLSGLLIRRALLSELGADWNNRLLLAYGLPPRPPGRGRGGARIGDAGPPMSDGDDIAPRRPPNAPPGEARYGDRDQGRDQDREKSALIGSLRLSDGSWLNFVTPAAAFQPFWATPLFFVVVGSTLAVAALSLWAVRRAARPLSMFTSAAERLGRDVDAPPLVEAGPIEVQRAAAAFNQMQTRLQALLRDRLQMLAALSHDLRTPITRLKLRAELIDDEQQQRKILADLSEIQSMVEASLAFARDETSREADVSFDLAVLLQTVCEEAEDSGGDAKYDGPDHAAYVGRPQTLKRAFANLVDNAVKYGGCARAMLEELPATFRVTIDDDGPGIPTGEIDKVFTPFYRVETSRSRETGGVGLGLAVVRSAVRLHGGNVSLRNRAAGGLSAVIELPKPSATSLSANSNTASPTPSDSSF